jgi:D-alanine--poly(phosphoribitol) ligase subunit 2
MNILEELIYPVVDEIRDSIESGDKLKKSPETPLFGAGSILDSLGLVVFIIAVESRMKKEIGKAITLANEEAMSRESSPFRTMGTLASYISDLLGREKNG